MIKCDKQTAVVCMALIVAIVPMALAGVAFLSRQAALEELTNQEHQLRVLQDQLELAAQQPAEPPKVASSKWRLTSGPEVVATMQRLQQLGDANGVTLDGLKAMRSADHGRQSFSVAGHAPPRSVCALIAAIEQDDRLMIIETGRLLPADGEHIAFEFGVATYYSGEQQ